MMGKNWMILVCLALLLFLTFPVCGESSVTGAWMLDRVFENASGNDRFELDPENSASLFAEAGNIYVFYADGTAGMMMSAGGEQFFLTGTWEQSADVYLFRTGEGDGLEFSFDGTVLHRYWKETDPGASYHDLDFVYSKVPAGCWQMSRVLSAGPDGTMTLLDPENAASLYAESSNIYCLFTDGKFSVLLSEGGEIVGTENGTWMKIADSYLLEDEALGMKLTFDSEKDLLHRVWTDDDPDAAYHSLDFIYLRK